jgi:PBSX family phage terminase large subunit
MLLSRLSLAGAQLLATCNPEGPAHLLKKEFLDKSEQLNIQSWRFELDDNPVLGKDFKDSLKKEYSGMWYRRYILGEWAVSHGLIHDGFDEDNLFDKDYQQPIYWVAGIDYGTTNPTACLLAAITPNQWPQIRVESEWYYSSESAGRAKTDAELAEGIIEFLQPQVRPSRAIYIDPSAASLKCEFQRRDMPVLDAKHDVLPGLRVVSKFVAGKNLLIRSSCKHTIEELYSYQWDPNYADKGEDRPIKKSDHCMDALRYLCYSTFPMGDFGSPDENLSYDNYRKLVYGNSSSVLFPETAVGGYL